jgi:hydrogenase nickel incorporation protein HypA/HybF
VSLPLTTKPSFWGTRRRAEGSPVRCTRMHEMALAEEILSVVLDAAGEEPVRKVELLVGTLQLVVPESLHFSFELVSEGTAAENATVKIQEILARLRCKKCNTQSAMNQPPFQCSQCGSSEVEVISGDEVLVDSVELENGEIIRRRAVAANQILARHIKDHHAHDHPPVKAPPS